MHGVYCLAYMQPMLYLHVCTYYLIHLIYYNILTFSLKQWSRCFLNFLTWLNRIMTCYLVQVIFTNYQWKQTCIYLHTYIHTYVVVQILVKYINLALALCICTYVYVTYFGTDSHENQFPIVTSYSNHNNVVYDKMSTQSCDHSSWIWSCILSSALMDQVEQMCSPAPTVQYFYSISIMQSRCSQLYRCTLHTVMTYTFICICTVHI